MKMIDLNYSQFGGQAPGVPSVALRIQTRANGDVEIVDNDRNGDKLLGVIPKSKRAELAQFLVEAE